MKENLIIKEGSSYKTIKKFTELLQSNVLAAEDIKLVKIYYNTSKGLPSPDNIEEFPVIFKTASGHNIYLFDLAAGYGGEGPHTLLDILKLAGFKDINEKDILSHQDIVDLVYCK